MFVEGNRSASASRTAAVGDIHRSPESSVRLSLVVPTYNEAVRIEGSLRAICRHLHALGVRYEILPVDDGSVDRTAEVARIASRDLAGRYGDVIRVVSVGRHRGKGSAVRRGILAARGELIVVMDADLSIPIVLADRLAECLDKGFDVAVASRFLPGSGPDRRPLVRRVMTAIFRVLVRAILTDRFTDTQCGAKAYRREVAVDLFQRQRLDGFAFDAEVLFLADRRGYRVREVHCALVPSDRSSVRYVSHSLGMLRDLLAVRMNAILGRYD